MTEMKKSLGKTSMPPVTMLVELAQKKESVTVVAAEAKWSKEKIECE